MTTSISKAVRGTRNIEAKNVTRKEKAGKEKVSSAPIQIGLGTKHYAALKAQTETVRQFILSVGNKSVEQLKQVRAELRLCVVKDQCAAADVEYQQGLAADAYMAKSGTVLYKKQRSIAANIARTVSILTALIDGRNVTNIMKADSLADMQGFANQSGGASKKGKQFTAAGFKAWEKHVDRIVKDVKDAEAIARLETHIMHVLRIAEKYSTALSPAVKHAVIGTKLPAKAGRKAA